MIASVHVWGADERSGGGYGCCSHGASVRVLCTTPTETLTPAAMVRMDSPRLRRARDGGALVVVDHGAAAADAAAFAGGFEPVVGLAHDVSAPVLGQGEGQVEDQGTFGGARRPRCPPAP